jgi:AcrR family transcriptional regulator
MTIYLSTRLAYFFSMPAKRPKRNAAAANQESIRHGDAPGSTRDRILAAAQTLFARHGFAGVSMPSIAKASGITAGAIYKHFESKDDLFFEVVSRTVRSAPLPEVRASTSAAAVLPSIVATYTTHKLKLLRQLALEIHAASDKHPKVRRMLRQSLDRTIAQISSTISVAQDNGDIDRTLDAEMLASTVMVFIMGLMHMETLLPRRVGDPKWNAFVQDRVRALISLRSAGGGRSPPPTCLTAN